MHKPESAMENPTHKILEDFEIQKEHSIQAKSGHLVDLDTPADYTVKIQESEEITFLDLVKELKKLRNRKVTVIPTRVGALGTILNNWKTLCEKLTRSEIIIIIIIIIGSFHTSVN